MTTPHQKTVHTVIAELTRTLQDRYCDAQHAQQIAWWIMEAVTQQSKLTLITSQPFPLTNEHTQQIAHILTQHLEYDYLLQYLLKTMNFVGLTLHVEPPTLIPRPETEEWVTQLIQTLEPVKNIPLTILDLCTGSGCIGLALAHAYPQATVWALDIADTALVLAQKNAARNNITNIRFLKSDLYHQLPEGIKFDLIVSNPPYIGPEEWHELSPVVTKWEDRGALIAGNHGLELIEHIVADAHAYLKQQSIVSVHGIPRLIIEIGHKQGLNVQHLCLEAGFDTVNTVKDLYDRDRIVVCF